MCLWNILYCGGGEHISVAFKHVFFEWAVNTEVLFLAGSVCFRGEHDNTSEEAMYRSECWYCHFSAHCIFSSGKLDELYSVAIKYFGIPFDSFAFEWIVWRKWL